ncbi:ABC transporter substrate-binding protein [Paenibacillus sp. GCM10028914]|uniref:ABC transporter substrate-binding protein n=1 Tax=Paenibacillus sp. GCM10028914 TaxID=3273416 RepID=UPI00361DF21A
MKRIGKRSFTLMLLACFMLISSACGSNSAQPQGASSDTAEAAGASTPISKEPVKVVWWHSMSGELGTVADKLISDFNAEHPDIQVEGVFQGTYDESLNKLKASLGSASGPAMIQVYEIGSRFMMDTKAVKPVQDFIDAEQYDISSLEPNIKSYYTFDDKLYSMPFNSSNPILYYNKDAFKAAGLDPENPPKTYEEVADAAKQLTKDGQTGASFAIYGWFIEQFFANQGVELLNNGNGRSEIATASQVNHAAGVKTLEWWKAMLDNKTLLNLGRKTDDTKKAFAAGQVAMMLDSTASLRGIVSASEGKFEVGTAFLPKPSDGGAGGVIIGGASLWLLNNKTEAEQQGAWEFMKYLAEPKTQAYWHVNTGYFPVTTKAYDETIVKENLAKYPQFQTAIDQLHQTEPNQATQGAVMGVFPEARQITETAIEEVLNGKKTPQEALDSAAQEITSKIETYNKTVK